jgi:thioredoxin reductase
MMSVDWDVLIIGRSYAGLSAALNLGRARRSVLAVGSGGPRNESVFHAHGLITQDGASPGDIIAAAEKELNKYPTVELVDDRVTGLAEHWGRGVFTCAYCDGFEHGDTHLALTGSTFFVPPIARILTGWSPHVTAFSNDLDAAVRAELGAHGVNVDERPIARVNGDGSTVSSLELTDAPTCRSARFLSPSGPPRTTNSP